MPTAYPKNSTPARSSRPPKIVGSPKGDRFGELDTQRGLKRGDAAIPILPHQAFTTERKPCSKSGSVIYSRIGHPLHFGGCPPRLDAGCVASLSSIGAALRAPRRLYRQLAPDLEA